MRAVDSLGHEERRYDKRPSPSPTGADGAGVDLDLVYLGGFGASARHVLHGRAASTGLEPRVLTLQAVDQSGELLEALGLRFVQCLEVGEVVCHLHAKSVANSRTEIYTSPRLASWRWILDLARQALWASRFCILLLSLLLPFAAPRSNSSISRCFSSSRCFVSRSYRRRSLSGDHVSLRRRFCVEDPPPHQSASETSPSDRLRRVQVDTDLEARSSSLSDSEGSGDVLHRIDAG